MREHEVIGNGKAILVRASTRAGLLGAAVQGMMAASGARPAAVAPDEQKSERPFSIEAEDFGELLAKLLAEAAKQAAANKESYEDITFTLITDKKAVGAFVGTPAKGFDSPKSGVMAPDEVHKNEAGEWEVTLTVKK